MNTVCLIGCNQSSNGVPDKAPAAENCLGNVCEDSLKDCQMAERCNKTLSPPRCQRLYCGPTGTACDQDAICAQGDYCRKQKCASNDTPTVVCETMSPHRCYAFSSGFESSSKYFCPALSRHSLDGGHEVDVCPMAGVVGGCKFTRDKDWYIEWYYDGTVDSVMKQCAGSTFVAPTQ